MGLLNHPNIAKLIKVIETGQITNLVMEYVAGGTVSDYLCENGAFGETLARRLIRQLDPALEYCHRKKIVHR